MPVSLGKKMTPELPQMYPLEYEWMLDKTAVVASAVRASIEYKGAI